PPRRVSFARVGFQTEELSWDGRGPFKRSVKKALQEVGETNGGAIGFRHAFPRRCVIRRAAADPVVVGD
ncbi:MAG TPA: hypothetical protein VGP23_02735, partial [Candidatus Binataceae bacterium]|nr:hypothetical protein [Candidatus Binataceae bacterium]